MLCLVHPMAPQGATRDCGGENEESLAVITVSAAPPLVPAAPPSPRRRGDNKAEENPPARKDRSILRTFFHNPFLHNLRQSRPFYLSIHFLQSSSIGSRNSLLLMKDSLQA